MKDTYIKFLILFTFFLVLFSMYFLRPTIQGDGDTYFEAMKVLDSGISPQGFVPNRILTTFLGLETALIFMKVVGGINGWFGMNVIFYFISSIVFYKLLLKIIDSEKAALLGTLFFVSNYAIIEFGLNFLMDMPAWSMYIVSLFFTLQYMRDASDINASLSALVIGIGGIFKEYAFLGAIPLFGAIIYENRSQIRDMALKMVLPVFIIAVPTLILHFYVYNKFGYTYLDWLNSNQDQYHYTSRLSEYVKSVGSLLNILFIFLIGGFWALRSEWQIISEKTKVFICLAAASVLPIFIWPAITQRVLFVMVPIVVVVSSFLFKKYHSRWYLFFPPLVIYILVNFLMDSVILNLVNLPF